MLVIAFRWTESGGDSSLIVGVISDVLVTALAMFGPEENGCRFLRFPV